jgi:hypothetical protein
MATHWTVKERYNRKAYDRIVIIVPRGQREIIKKQADRLNMSVSAYIRDLIYKSLKPPLNMSESASAYIRDLICKSLKPR